MIRSLSIGRVAVCMLLLLGSSVSCSRVGRERPEIAPQDPLWSQVVNAHTSGLVSKKAKIRVLFVNDVVDEGRVGQDAASILRVDPRIKGVTTFTSPREIVLVPDQDLDSGRHFRVTVEARALSGIPKELDRYEFAFQVLEQQFEINIDGLGASAANDGEMVLEGSVLTSDVEDADRVEKMLSASFLDEPVSIEWQHNVNGKLHDFSIPGIVRQAGPETVRLQWDGEIIGVDTRGKRDIEVPDKDRFEVVQVKAIRDRQQHLQVYFSDNLDPRQDLTGLVRLDKGSFTTRIEGNLLKIYPDEATVGELLVTLEPGIVNADGARLVNQEQHAVTLVTVNPQVRFVGQGVILPENPVLSIPFEAVGVQSVRVTAFRIYENNMGQFLQTNTLDGSSELGRVGRYLWRRTLHLSSPESNKWNRYSLDATELFRDDPGGLYRLTLSIRRSDSTFECSGDVREDSETEPPLANDTDLNVNDASSWDYWENYYGTASDGSNWNDRNDPCKLAYYKYSDGVKDARNFLTSNIGLLAKRDQHGELLVVATDLRTAKPMRGVNLSVMNFQNRVVGNAVTNSNGFAELDVDATPFYLLAEKSGEKGYLKLSKGTTLPTSHFDVGGEKVTDGIKGMIYGERGVWRPGDEMYLTFVLEDKDQSIPDGHPATMELYNPKGQLMATQTNNLPVGGFYPFVMETADDAPTGLWQAKAILGGNTFTKAVRVETVMPNRLKVDLDFGREVLTRSEMPLQGKLFAQWLSGATASSLEADVSIRLRTTPTRFSRNTDFVFDDPVREFQGEPETLFEGKLDGQGYANFSGDLSLEQEAPGMLNAGFTSRVFERGGAFSVSRQSMPFSPFERYVGVKMPKGDEARNMLLTDVDHVVEIASLNADGEPVSLESIELTLYKIEWKWWWDKSGDRLSQYASASHSGVVAKDTVATENGGGNWTFQIKYPSWGRYLLRACDAEGGHCTGKVFYIDWPGWAGRAQEQGGPGANVLTFVADKSEYLVGEVAKLKLPEASEGRALLTIENGTGILQQRWIEFPDEETSLEVPITKAMSPNVYVSVTLLQPHADKKNDRPIRLYGIIPLKVNDPETRLAPLLEAPEEWAPETTAHIVVSEAEGRPMFYTVAVVDEGLLGLTSFKTPHLHDHFYKREALGVSTWDLFDHVVGAYGGELERLLALGGGDTDLQPEKQERKRFPPVVSYLGPFQLEAGAKNAHEFALPQYVGAVRVMVVAGRDGAYGSTDKSVFVRQPLMILATLPRVIGPGEELSAPVSVFVMDPAIKDVSLSVEPDHHFDIVGDETVTVTFSEPEEKIGMLNFKVRPRLGKGRLRFTARAAGHSARAEIYIDIRNPNPPTVEQVSKVLSAGETWETDIVPHGMEGTNEVSLEVSSVPPLGLERRLAYLIQYPHGCLEQVTSSVFPQLYLSQLVNLEETRKTEIENNIAAGIDRLRGFQVGSGAFVYWPGGFWVSSGFDARNAWSTNYAGHFLLEAEKLGYHVPAEMSSDWLQYQKSAAQSWSAGTDTSVLDQAYRLYTLALANRPELGAMNRLRETRDLTSVARWQLAAAYRLAGLVEVANDLVERDRIEIRDYEQPDFTFGSGLRDRAIVLNAMLILNRENGLKDIVDQVSSELASNKWHSTQSVAFGLLAMAKFAGAADTGTPSFEVRVGDRPQQLVRMGKPIYTRSLDDIPASGSRVTLVNPSNDRTLFATVAVRGTPMAGEEKASASGLGIDLLYTHPDGDSLDIERLDQGNDFVATVKVTNRTGVNLENLALTHIMPSGWEIHNTRLDESGEPEPSDLDYEDIRDDRVYRYFGLKAGETKVFTTFLNAAYLGRYYLPSVTVEAMYDVSKQARTKGRWVEVTSSRQ